MNFEEALVALDPLRLATALDRLQPGRRHGVKTGRGPAVGDECFLLARQLQVDGESLSVPLEPEAALGPLQAVRVPITDSYPRRRLRLSPGWRVRS